LYLKRETDFFSKKIKVLHFAPEAAFLEKFKKLKNISYDTIDLNSPLADIKADICNLPINSDSYDFILCNHVLEHIIDDEKAMKELYRVLKKGGTGIFQVPLNMSNKQTYEDFTITDPKERNKAFGQYDHVRVYGMDFFERLEKVGFKVEKCEYTLKLSEEEKIKYCLPKKEIIPICVK
jgi:ubiquinone/menaquinone biosynthesis C-methylase UbiE